MYYAGNKYTVLWLSGGDCDILGFVGFGFCSCCLLCLVAVTYELLLNYDSISMLKDPYQSKMLCGVIILLTLPCIQRWS